jgi:capsular exopolysaccharide synthesis family protein
MTVLLGTVAFFLPMIAICWWDARAQTITSAADVGHLLGPRVIGSLPILPRRALRRLHGHESRGSPWTSSLRESVDGVRTLLLRISDLEPARLVLVTSAIRGEGKTTLATQLATSYARAHCRTVLVDFDLRSPAVHRAIGLPVAPGVSELLRGKATVEEVLQPSAQDDLWAVGAGECDEEALLALPQTGVAEFLGRLREEFDFVVVDSGPVLPVADALVIGRHVDIAVLAVMRDVSQAPKILAAYERLTALGIRVLGAIVTGKQDETVRSYYQYVRHA